MAFSFRGRSDDAPLLKSNLPVSSGPAEADEDEPTPRTSARATAAPKREPKELPHVDVIPPEDRKAVMNGLDHTEYRWSAAGLVVLTVVAIFLTVYLSVGNPTKSVTVRHHVVHEPLSASYILYGVVMLLFAAIGAYGLYRRKRTLTAFSFILSGFALTLIIGPFGFPAIILGGWLMWRAYRIQKYGTANSKEVAIVARQMPARAPRQPRAPRTASPPTRPTGHKAPTASKRYTPKSAPRKKIPKPVD